MRHCLAGVLQRQVAARARQRHELLEAKDLLVAAASGAQVCVCQPGKHLLHGTEHVRGQLLVFHLERRRLSTPLQEIGSLHHLPSHIQHRVVFAAKGYAGQGIEALKD